MAYSLTQPTNTLAVVACHKSFICRLMPNSINPRHAPHTVILPILIFGSSFAIELHLFLKQLGPVRLNAGWVKGASSHIYH